MRLAPARATNLRVLFMVLSFLGWVDHFDLIGAPARVGSKWLHTRVDRWEGSLPGLLFP